MVQRTWHFSAYYVKSYQLNMVQNILDLDKVVSQEFCAETLDRIGNEETLSDEECNF